ncbi:MAG: hypothetical protein GX094_06660 [Clostridiales bacterium]|jgi:CRISPR/Cas system CSM-associated protein Csm3 (group 7 of RAMP superfamily)|nr:hypothetical protein [Clostridiales bacterium]
MIKPYDFVPFLKCEPYNQAGDLEGIIPITIETLTPVHISSGRYNVRGNNIYKEFVRINGRIVIPGTSLKGCIRNIAESISYSCISERDRERRKMPANKFHLSDQKCIICDMFGSWGNRSKLVFRDIKLENEKTEIIGLPRSFAPHPESNYYIKDGKYKGYKFYKHGINGIQPKGSVHYEFVRAGARFKGEITFRGLTDAQLELLCFALGLSGDINPKIGYGKNYFYGSVTISSEEKWAELARNYFQKCPQDIKANIRRLIDILNYKDNALKALE